MFRNLEQILFMIAKSKKVKDEKTWVNKILKHCEIHSDYTKDCLMLQKQKAMKDYIC